MNTVGLYTFIRKEIERMFRIAIQTLITPWISALLYIFIFGFIVGKKIELINGVSYIDFVLPGILMMNVITSAFSHSSGSLYFARFLRNIDEILVAPLSHSEMVIGFAVGAIARGVIIGLGILLIAVFFGAANLTHLPIFLLYLVGVSAIFACIGLLVGLWANGFEQLNVLNAFVIMPLSFLGGVFYSVSMLPEKLQFIAHWNPFFYFIDGIRYGMLGIKESNHIIGYILMAGLVICLSILVERLFKYGWRLRN